MFKTECVDIKTEPLDNESDDVLYESCSSHLNNNTEYREVVEFQHIKTENYFYPESQANLLLQSDNLCNKTNYGNIGGLYPTAMETDFSYNYDNGQDDDDSSNKSLDLHVCQYNCEKSLLGRFKLPTFDGGCSTRRRQCFNVKTSPKLYKCQLCIREFHQMANLSGHLEYTHGVKAYSKCNGCFGVFDLKITTGQCSPRIMCNRCEKKLRNPESSRTTRVGNKHRCNVCSKLLCSPYVLAEHMRLHTGEKPYKCKLCPKQYTKSSTLTNHLKIVHRLIKRNVVQYHPTCQEKI
ncbi:zinc finger protein 888-like [Adelges cooleyi]|uniref:zinc finger protein 888-like n=1 Tax=Adelges cooleyi TaxID=133065 RepID=UPI00217FEBF6|nr:zinc finger protein 888-like [Adelges cooleyi]